MTRKLLWISPVYTHDCVYYPQSDKNSIRLMEICFTLTNESATDILYSYTSPVYQKTSNLDLFLDKKHLNIFTKNKLYSELVENGDADYGVSIYNIDRHVSTDLITHVQSDTVLLCGERLINIIPILQEEFPHIFTYIDLNTVIDIDTVNFMSIGRILDDTTLNSTRAKTKCMKNVTHYHQMMNVYQEYVKTILSK